MKLQIRSELRRGDRNLADAMLGEAEFAGNVHRGAADVTGRAAFFNRNPFEVGNVRR